MHGLFRDLILPGMRGGHSMDNIHRISILGGDDIKVPSLGKPGTSVSVHIILMFVIYLLVSD